MKTLSTGHNSTLGNYRLLTKTFFGEHSAAMTWLDEKIEEQGEDMEVIADECQVLQFLIGLHIGTSTTDEEPRVCAGIE